MPKKRYTFGDKVLLLFVSLTLIEVSLGTQSPNFFQVLQAQSEEGFYCQGEVRAVNSSLPLNILLGILVKGIYTAFNPLSANNPLNWPCSTVTFKIVVCYQCKQQV